MAQGIYSRQDVQLERDIEAACSIVTNPGIDRFTRVTAAESMRRLIALRSPNRVASMEREKGLA